VSCVAWLVSWWNRPKSLVQEIDEFESPPSRAQIDRVQESLNQLQRQLNRIQTETDAWSEEKEAV